jgi:hypothetical protein
MWKSRRISDALKKEGRARTQRGKESAEFYGLEIVAF